MKNTMGKGQATALYLTLIAGALILLCVGGVARQGTVPEEPLVVPIGETDEIWEMSDLSPGETGGRVKFSAERFPETFNDLIADSKPSTDVTRIIMGSGLVAENPVNGRITPALAKSWSVSEDGLTYTFTLREGLKFSDGKPLTAEDVVFTYEELVFNSDVDTEKRDLIRINNELPEVKKVDEYRVQFTLPEPFGPFLSRVSTGIYPKHRLEDLTGDEFNSSWGRETAEEAPEEIVGAGPFQLEKFIPGEEIVMSRNPYYYKTDPEGTQLPYLDSYRVLKVKDNDIEFLKFKSDDTDLLRPQIEDMPYLLSQQDEENWRVDTGEGDSGAPMSAEFITFNWETEDKELAEIFRSPKFRKAVSVSINREEIFKDVYNSFGKFQYGPISRLSPYHKENMKEVLPYEFDPEKGNQLLEELGITDGDGDGTRELDGSKQAEFEIIVNGGNRVRTQIGGIIAKNLKELGLEAKVNSLEFEEFSSRLIRGNYEAGIVSLLTNPAIPETLADIFETSGPLHLWHTGTKIEPASWEKEVDRIFRQGLKANSFQERKRYYDEFQELYARKLPIVYIAGESFLYATDDDLRNTDEFSRIGTFPDFAEYVWVEK